MTLIKSNSSNPIPQFFDDFFTRNRHDWGLDNFFSEGSTLPAVNLRETNDDYVIEMAAPGMTKEDFNIELDNGRLSISAQQEQKTVSDHESKVHRQEFSYQTFTRSFFLSNEVVDESKIKANYKNGVLEVVIPKKEEMKKLPPKTIKIS